MSKLIICNTYYQLVVALQLTLTKFKNEDVYLLVTDHSLNADKIVENLKMQKIFNDVIFFETRELEYAKLNIQRLYNSVTPAILGNMKNPKILPKEIDEVIYYNLSFLVLHIFARLYKINPDIKYSRMEEGVLSYNVFFHDGQGDLGFRLNLVVKLRRLLLKKNIFNLVKNFYCFQPSFYKGNLTPVEIEKISLKGKMKDILTKSFSLGLTRESYKEKYIFFTSVCDFEGGEPIGEYELVCKTADLVGKENLLIKTHPRDTRTIYEDNGFKVDKNSSVPWEAIQLSRDFSDKVFLTATSGSVLAGSFMSENPPKTFFMHKCCDISGNPTAKKSVETIEELLRDEALKDSLTTVSSVNDVKDILI